MLPSMLPYVAELLARGASLTCILRCPEHNFSALVRKTERKGKNTPKTRQSAGPRAWRLTEYAARTRGVAQWFKTRFQGEKVNFQKPF